MILQILKLWLIPMVPFISILICIFLIWMFALRIHSNQQNGLARILDILSYLFVILLAGAILIRIVLLMLGYPDIFENLI